MARTPRRQRGRPSRRSLLAAGGGIAGWGALGLTGCEALSTTPAGTGRDLERRPKGREAPVLAERVKAGDLPKVEDRLPDTPMVVETVERPGDYGGDWRGVLFGAFETGWVGRTLGYDNLTRWQSPRPGGVPVVVPNLAERLEGDATGTEYVVTLRRGLKWSDGAPFTADDIVFAQNDVNNNTDLSPIPPWRGTAEKVDDITVRLVFDEPEGLFPEIQAGPGGDNLVIRPRHYLERFHADFQPEIDKLVEDEGFDDWMALFLAKADPWQNPLLPTMAAWRAVNPYGDSQRFRLERNPFYWKVDGDGSQLPYIDSVTFQILNDPEVAVVQASNGQIDFIERTINTLRNKPVLARNREPGDYRFFDRVSALENFTVIALNLSHQDPVKRELYNDRDFRVGLSHAIDRQEVIDTVFAAQGEPYQVAPRPESPYFDEEFAKQYTEYDVDAANASLDRACPGKDGEGFRLGPDGRRVVVGVEFANSFAPEWTDTLELVKGYWEAVGVQVDLQPMNRTLLYERKEGNQHDANVWEGAAGWRDDVLLEPRWYFPFSIESNYAIGWALWLNSDGAQGVEPPEPAKEQRRLYDRIHATTAREEQDRLMREILRIAKEQFYVIGVNLAPEGYGIASNRFRNVPRTMVASWIYQPPGLSCPEQFFIAADGQ